MVNIQNKVLDEPLATAADRSRAPERHWLYSLRGVIALTSIYSVLHVGARLLASPNLGEDDPFETIYAQVLQLGYFPTQPPLYDWILWGVQHVTGPGLISFLIIKYGLLIAIAGFLFLCTLRVTHHPVWAILAVEGLALIYQISWRFHEGFTHTVIAMFAVVATLWAFFRIIDHERAITDFGLLGLFAGLGLLSKFSFAAFFGVLLCAGWLQPAIRQAVFSTKLIFSFAIIGVISGPFYWWLLSDPNHIALLMAGPPDEYHLSHAYKAMRGLGDAITVPVLFLSPFIFLLPIYFRTIPLKAWKDLCAPINRTNQANLEQLIMHLTLLALVALVLGALIGGISSYPVHALIPIFLPTIIWLTALAKRSCKNEEIRKQFMILACIIALVAFVARIGNMFILDPFCNTCRWGIPYTALAREIRALGFKHGTFLTVEHELAGNLRWLFPKDRFVNRDWPNFAPPLRSDQKQDPQLVIVWGPKFDKATVTEFLKADLPQGVSLDRAKIIRIPWHHLWKPVGYRYSEWKVLIVPDNR